MFKVISKYKLQFDIAAVLVWGFIAAEKIFFNHSEEKRNFYLFVGIIATLLMIVKIGDVIEGIRNKNKKNHTFGE